MSGSLAGISVSGQRLMLAERDFAEEHDVYRCLNTETGELLWRIQFRATGTLDYGQSPRATPVIEENRAYLLGAFGELRCIDVSTGTPAQFRVFLKDEIDKWTKVIRETGIDPI